MPATVPWEWGASLTLCGWSRGCRKSRNAVSMSWARSATASAHGGLKYPWSQTRVASGRLVTAWRTMAAGGPWSPTMIWSRVPSARRGLGSRRGGQTRVSDARRSGYACTKPVISAGREAAKCARSIPRCWSTWARRSATEVPAAVIYLPPLPCVPMHVWGRVEHNDHPFPRLHQFT